MTRGLQPILYSNALCSHQLVQAATFNVAAEAGVAVHGRVERLWSMREP